MRRTTHEIHLLHVPFGAPRNQWAFQVVCVIRVVHISSVVTRLTLVGAIELPKTLMQLISRPHYLVLFYRPSLACFVPYYKRELDSNKLATLPDGIFDQLGSLSLL